MALELSDHRLLHAHVDLREARAERRPAHDVCPELEEDREPAVVLAAPPRRRERQGVEPARVVGGGDLALDLGDPALRAALVDGEEEVLLRREVRVDRAPGVAGLAGDLVDRRGVEPLLDEETVGRLDNPLAGLLLLLGSGQAHSHTVGILMLSNI